MFITTGLCQTVVFEKRLSKDFRKHSDIQRIYENRSARVLELRCVGADRRQHIFQTGTNLSKNSGSARRYNYMKLLAKEEVLGNSNNCKGAKNVTIYIKDLDLLVPGLSDICFCTCDDVCNNHTLRHFSLRDVISDVKDNKVIRCETREQE
ncbi:uncharacterized protein LOC100678267 [Nasonia vitripennis]|uniref:Uncharacterized protein n=1 Tax=Nasonia vitripennis TaxID=7425 RepID=A0A7M7T847_NASVI|nr:uncharacterized protein LOC100678267 [Nasonia vitripennis]